MSAWAMIRKSPRRHWVKQRRAGLARTCRVAVAGWAAAWLALGATAMAADPPRRIVSINLCTDQLLLALAEPERIAGLGRFARRADMAYLAAAARAHPIVRGTAEEVLRLRPDLVLAGAFSGRATRAVLQAHGIRVETFAPPRSIAEARAEIIRVSGMTGAAQRGAALIAEIDAAVGEAAALVRPKVALTALPLQRRGYASGRDTLVSSVLEAAGLVNAAAALGIDGIGRAPIEAIAKLRPDILIVEGLGPAGDQATALLHHPVLARGLRSRIVALPTTEVACGGPSLPALLRRVSGAALSR